MSVMSWSAAEIEQMPRESRRTLINRISGAKLAWLLGSFSPLHGPNLAVFSQVVHIGANPPLLGVFFRPEAGNQRHSYHNILETGLFSLNALHENHAENIHRCSANFPVGVSEFDASGLTLETHDQSPLPFVGEALWQLAMEPVEWSLIQSNKVQLLVAKILEIRLINAPLDDNLMPLPNELAHVCGTDLYTSARAFKRLPHAKP